MAKVIFLPKAVLLTPRFSQLGELYCSLGKDGSTHLLAPTYIVSPSGSIILFYLCFKGLTHGKKNLTSALFLAQSSKTQLLSLLFWREWEEERRKLLLTALWDLLRDQKLLFQREAVITLMVMAEATQTQAESSGYWLWVHVSGYFPSDQWNAPHCGTHLCNLHYVCSYCYSYKQLRLLFYFKFFFFIYLDF